MNRQIVIARLRKLWYAGKDFLRYPRQFVATILHTVQPTDYERWSSHHSLQSSWDERTKIMAAFIPSGTSVIEFGSGAQVLQNFLPSDVRYQPYDLVARTPSTIVCDLNNCFPDISGDSNIVVFSGVLEYIVNLPALFCWLRKSAKKVVFSYAIHEHTPSLFERRRNGWVNDFTEAEILQVVTRAGFKGGAVSRWRGHVIFVVNSL